MKINPNVGASSIPKTETQPDSTNPKVNTSTGIATAKDAFLDASEDSKVSSALGSVNNPAGYHNIIDTKDPKSDSTSVRITSDPVLQGQNNESDSGWQPGNVFKVDGDTNVKISASDGDRQTITRKDDDDD